MKKTVAANILLLASFGIFQTLNSISLPHDAWKSLRIELSNANTSIQDGTQEVTTRGLKDICGVPANDSKEAERMKRSDRHSLAGPVPTLISQPTTVDYSHLSEKFINCGHLTLPPECYQKLQNGSVHVPLYKRVFFRSAYLITDDILFICPDFFGTKEEGEKFPLHLSVISLAGSGISALCLILHIIVYVAIKTVKNLPSRCLLSLCIALLLAYFFTFVQHAATDHESCRVVGMFMVYFFLAAFFWMSVFSYDVWRSIRLATTKLRLTADRPMMVRFARYSLYGWGSPLLITIASIIIHNSTSNPKYQLIFDIDICWFANKPALALYFVGPLFTLLGLNILLTASSFFMISTASMKSSCGKDSFDLRARFCLSLRLGSSMGLMWIFGVLAVATKQEWLWSLFAICSALQGVFIFLSFTLSARSRKECKKALQNRKCSTTPTQSSSNHITSV